MAVFTHLDGNNRHTIQTGLERGDTFLKIAQAIAKHPTTVANEVRKYRSFRKSGGRGSCFNNCNNRFTCQKTNLCDSTLCKVKHCRYCARCSEHCNDYVRQRCLKLDKPPYVCSGCSRLGTCTMEKAFYDAAAANEAAAFTLHESRFGIRADESEILRWDAAIAPLVKQGLSLYHIRHTLAERVSLPPLRTLYSYVEKKALPSICGVDLPRKVKYKKRRTSEIERHAKVDRYCRNGRKYADFLAYMKDNQDTPVVEMDSVVDANEQYSLLTIHFTTSSLMLAYFRKGNIAADVVTILDELTQTLGIDLFRSLFPVILTDNGSEFSNPTRLETAPDGQNRTRIFYCDPNASFQKGAIENNHELIRRVLPKGTSFEGLTQNDVVKMMGHINSYKRQKLNGRTPYDTFSFLHSPKGDKLLGTLGVLRVKADKIVLLPNLVRHK